MKKLENLKTLELLVFVFLAGLCFYLIVFQTNVYHIIAQSKELQLVCGLLWITLFVAFIFVFVDFSLYSKQKNDFNALDYAVHSDSLAKIANRQGIDECIEKYIDKPLPENMGCAMFLLTSLNEINRKSRVEGNNQIRNFSIILKLASTDICFVGRNGGNVFMAIFEGTPQEKLNIFMGRVKNKVLEYNRNKSNLPMYYQMGLAYNENPPVETINGLISLASRRSHEAPTTPNNITNIADRRPKVLVDSQMATSDEEARTVATVVPNKPRQKATYDEKGIPSFALKLKRKKSKSGKIEKFEVEEVKSENAKTAEIKNDVITLEEDEYRYSFEDMQGTAREYKDYYREAI